MNFSQKTDKEILSIANPIMDNVIEGSNESNYEKFSKDFSNIMNDAVPEEEFRRQLIEFHPKFGDIKKNREFIHCIRRNSGVTVLWTGYYEISKGEHLSLLTLDEEDGRIKIFGVTVD